MQLSMCVYKQNILFNVYMYTAQKATSFLEREYMFHTLLYVFSSQDANARVVLFLQSQTFLFFCITA